MLSQQKSEPTKTNRYFQNQDIVNKLKTKCKQIQTYLHQIAVQDLRKQIKNT